MIRVHHSAGHNKVGMYSGVSLPLKQVLLFQKKGAGVGMMVGLLAWLSAGN